MKFNLIKGILIIFLLFFSSISGAVALSNQLLVTKEKTWGGDTLEYRTLGNEDAEVTLEIFLNYYDYLSMKWHNVEMPKIINYYVNPGKVKLIVRHFPAPLDSHPNILAILLSDGAECAAKQKRFFEYIDYAYRHQNEIRGINDVKNIAQEIGDINVARFNLCFINANTHNGVNNDLEYGYSIMSEPITSPVFFVNGYEIRGTDDNSNNILMDKLKEEIKKTSAPGTNKIKKKVLSPGYNFFKEELKNILL